MAWLCKSVHDLISIIVPVYNSEKYLRKCLDSLVNQTYREIEIICVNDGSTDSSYSILEDYCKKDSRFVLINNNHNQGVAYARNMGISYCRGKYVSFVDSDDFVDLDYIQYLYNGIIVNDADISICGFCSIIVDEKRTIKQKYDDGSIDNIQLLTEIIKDEKYGNYLWHKLIRRSIIPRNLFCAELKSFSDVDSLYKIVMNAKKINTLSKIKYNYFYRSKSLCSDLDFNKITFFCTAIINRYNSLTLSFPTLNDIQIEYLLKTIWYYAIPLVIKHDYNEEELKKFRSIVVPFLTSNYDIICNHSIPNQYKLLATIIIHCPINIWGVLLEEIYSGNMAHSICSSFSYKIGRILTYLPRKIIEIHRGLRPNNKCK